MNRFTTFICVAGLALLSACLSNSYGHRPTNCNPDERLDELLKDYEAAKHDNKSGGQSDHILVDCDRIRVEIERLSAEFPQHVPTLMANARLSFEVKEPAKAQRYLDRLFGLQPVHAEAAVLRAQIAIGEGNVPFAKRLLEKQVNYTPDHYGLRETWSAALYMSGDLPGARAQLEVAEKLGAPAWRVAFNRGLIAEAVGDKGEAMKQYEASVAGNPDFKPAQARLSGKRAEGGYNKPSAPSGKTGGE